MQTAPVTTATTVPNAAANAYFDRPADKRLRPWILLGSLFLLCLAIPQIIVPWTSWGEGRSLFGIFITGVVLSVAALTGLLAATNRRPGTAKLVSVLVCCYCGYCFAVHVFSLSIY